MVIKWHTSGVEELGHLRDDFVILIVGAVRSHIVVQQFLFFHLGIDDLKCLSGVQRFVTFPAKPDIEGRRPIRVFDGNVFNTVKINTDVDRREVCVGGQWIWRSFTGFNGCSAHAQHVILGGVLLFQQDDVDGEPR